ncbi:MAG: hypothetical protein R3C68_01450 [Myxococcota bacterium]
MIVLVYLLFAIAVATADARDNYGALLVTGTVAAITLAGSH